MGPALVKFERDQRRDTLHGGPTYLDILVELEILENLKDGRESNKQAQKESKHALDVQHGSHTSHSMPNIEVSLIANYSWIFQGQQIEMTITLKPCVGLVQSTYHWKALFE